MTIYIFLNVDYRFIIIDVLSPMMKDEVGRQMTIIVNRVATEVTSMLGRLISMTGIVPFE